MLNDPVAGLIDFPLPREVGLWPETWASRFATVLVLLATLVALWLIVRRRRANRYRREALAELARVERTGAAPGEVLTRISLLLRRTALAAFPREEVAPLTGAAWLAFLDRTSGSRQFSEGDGRPLASGPYRAVPPADAEVRSLFVLARRWIGGHHV
jgi:Ca-activated chloride channel family protein